MVWRPTLKEIEVAAGVLHEAGLHHHWWMPYMKTYDEPCRDRRDWQG
jgi:hypothetical protein